MSEPRSEYKNTANFEILQGEISVLQAGLHDDIKRYEMDMSKELLADLRALDKSCRAVIKRMEKERG